MDRKKKIIIGVSAIVALFLVASAIRFFAFPATPATDEQVDQPRQEGADVDVPQQETPETTDNLGDMSGLSIEQKALMETLITSDWIDSQGNTIRFTTSTLIRQPNGSGEQEAQTFSLGATQLIKNESDVITNYVACISLNKEWTLLNLSYSADAVPTASTETGQVVAEDESSRNPAITISTFGATVYRPNEATAVDVNGLENINQAISGSIEVMTTKVQDFCRAIYPTATTATWTGVEHVLYAKDQDILYFKLNDVSTSSISVLYQPSSGNFEVQAGEKTEFSEDYATPGVS